VLVTGGRVFAIVQYGHPRHLEKPRADGLFPVFLQELERRGIALEADEPGAFSRTTCLGCPVRAEGRTRRHPAPSEKNGMGLQAQLRNQTAHRGLILGGPPLKRSGDDAQLAKPSPAREPQTSISRGRNYINAAI
jgi:hypothetical protein